MTLHLIVAEVAKTGEAATPVMTCGFCTKTVTGRERLWFSYGIAVSQAMTVKVWGPSGNRGCPAGVVAAVSQGIR